MNVKKPTPHTYWKYAFIAPVLFFMLLISKPFSALAQNGKQESVLLNVGSESENESVSEGCKELLRAVKGRDIAKVRELLETADPNCIYRGDGEPRSPLVSAARNGDSEIGKLLIEAGADIAFHAQGDETPLMAAAANGHLGFVKYLVANGAEVNKKLEGDGTALLLASREGHLETVRYLISIGAEVDAQVSGDGTPLIVSVQSGHYEVAKILLEKGADPNLASPGDDYPMAHARRSKDKLMITLLEKHEQK
jgi:ankyrin repeat protein